VALISALGALLLLTPLVLVLLSMGTFELLISRNLVDSTQALFAADAGIEWAFNLLVNTPDWSVLPLGPDTLVVPNDLLPRTTMSITVGKAARANDLTVTSTGVVNRAQRTIQAIIRRDPPTRPESSGAPVFDRHAVVSWHEP
jgi:hypothetical protein